MIYKATNRGLSTALSNHLEETKKQIQRVEAAFEALGQEPASVSCPAIDGIIKEADEIADEVGYKKVLDAAIIGSA